MSSKPTLRSGFSEEPKEKQLSLSKLLDAFQHLYQPEPPEPVATYPVLSEELWETLMSPLDQEPVGSIKLIK